MAVVVAVTVVAVVVEVEAVVFVVVVTGDEVVVDVVEVVVVFDELQDAKTSDITITPVSSIQSTPLFMWPPVLI